MKHVLFALAAFAILFQPLGCGEDEKQKAIDKKMKIYIRKLKSGKEDVRVDAADMLGNYGEKGAVAVPALIEALSDSSAEVRGHVARALGKIGPKASDAIEVLRKALGDADAVVGIQAAAAMMKIDSDTITEAMGVLTKAMKDPSPTVRGEAAAAMALVGEKVPAVINQLIAIVGNDNEDENVRIRAAVALGEIGPSAKRALPALSSLLGKGGELGPAATDAIKKIRK